MLITRLPNSDARLRLRFSPKELNKLVLRGLLANYDFNFLDRVFFFKRFSKYFFKYSISFFRNSCLFTGNARSIFRLFKLCRHSAKTYASNGSLMGMRKSSF